MEKADQTLNFFDTNLHQTEIDVISGHINFADKLFKSRFGRGVAMGLLAVSSGSLVGLANEVLDDPKEAYACDVVTEAGVSEDNNCNGIPDLLEGPSTTQPRGGGGSGGSGGGSGNTVPTPTTIPYGDRDTDSSNPDGVKNSLDNCDDVYNPDQANFDGDADGNACDNDADADGLPKQGGVYFNDENDLSVGLGEAGVQQARDSGVDVDSGSEEANRNYAIAFSVNPADWPARQAEYAGFGVSAMNETTTTTSISIAETATTAEETTTSSLTEETIGEVTESTTRTTIKDNAESDTTEQAVVPIIDNNDGQSGGESNSLILPISITGAVIAGSALLVGFARRRKEHTTETPGSVGGQTTSPSVGN